MLELYSLQHVNETSLRHATLQRRNASATNVGKLQYLPAHLEALPP
jgi:hypothetical protein